MYYDVFISYRRVVGRYLARLLQQALKARGLNCFFDYTSIRHGKFDETIFNAIENSAVFVLVMPDGTFDGCEDPRDWVRQEIEHAIKNHKEIVPVVPTGSVCAFPEDLADSIEPLRHYQISPLDTEQMFEESVDKIVRERISRNVSHGGRLATTPSPAIPILGKTGVISPPSELSWEDSKYYIRALGLYNVFRNRSALREFRRITRQDNPVVGYFVLRLRYEMEGGVAEDVLDSAIAAACACDCTDAMVAFAARHLNDLDKKNAFDSHSPSESLSWLNRAISLGDPNALVELGVAYQLGNGVPKNGDIARRLYLQSLEWDCLSGKMMLGLDYLNGDNGDPSPSEAARLLRPVVNHLSKYENELSRLPLVLLELAYFTGACGVGGDIERAKHYFDAAQNCKGREIAGDRAACVDAYALAGLCCLTAAHEAVERNNAVLFARRACELGCTNGMAEYALAICYEHGIGVGQDEAQAGNLYREAANWGFTPALLWLAKYYLSNGDNRNIRKGMAFLKEAAGAGDANALCLLGKSYAEGNGCEMNRAKAIECWERAADRGNAEACFLLGSDAIGASDGASAKTYAEWVRVIKARCAGKDARNAKFQIAEHWLQMALDSESCDEKIRGMCNLALARMARISGNMESASEFYANCVGVDNDLIAEEFYQLKRPIGSMWRCLLGVFHFRSL